MVSKQSSILSLALPWAAALPTTAEVGERRKRQRTTAEELVLDWPLNIARWCDGRASRAELWKQA